MTISSMIKLIGTQYLSALDLIQEAAEGAHIYWYQDGWSLNGLTLELENYIINGHSLRTLLQTIYL